MSFKDLKKQSSLGSLTQNLKGDISLESMVIYDIILGVWKGF
jgi:hypothetical protein